MGSKSKGKSYVSKGIVGSPMRTPITGAEKILNKVRVWKAGKPVKIFDNGEWVEAKTVWGSPVRKLKIETNDDE